MNIQKGIGNEKPFVSTHLQETNQNGENSGTSLTMYVCQLPKQQQEKIKIQLQKKGITGGDLQSAMNGRLCDLEEVLSVAQIINKSKSHDIER